MDRRVRTARYIHPNFSFTAFRMVMKRYRQGRDCDKLLELLAYRSGPIMEGAQVKKVIATPKIVGERLLMRVQTAYIVPPSRPSQVYLLDINLVKCPHTDSLVRDNRNVTKSLFKRFEALETVPRGRQEHIISCQCNFCPTEFHFSLEHFEGQGVMFLITKWLDLGTGLSPLESDLPPVIGYHHIMYEVRDQVEDRLAYESPHDRFEELAAVKDPQDVSALSSEERKDLFRKSDSRRARFMRRIDSACWSLWGFGQIYPHNFEPRDERCCRNGCDHIKRTPGP